MQCNILSRLTFMPDLTSNISSKYFFKIHSKACDNKEPKKTNLNLMS